MARGRISAEERGLRDIAKEATRKLIEKVDKGHLDLADDERLVDARARCVTALESPKQRLELRQALLSVTSPGNPSAINHLEIAALVKSQGWPKKLAVSSLSTTTITNFVKDGMTPKNAKFVGAYLYLLHLLRQENHPATKHLLARPMLAGCEALYLFSKALAATSSTGGTFRLDEILHGGRLFDEVIGMRGQPFAGAEFFRKELASAPLFKALKPAKTDKDLAAFALTSIRRDVDSGMYATSKVGFTLLVREHKDPQSTEDEPRMIRSSIVHLMTWMNPDEARPLSQGFLIPRKREVYLAQSHMDGAGLNITAIDLPDFEKRDSYLRGVILAVDRHRDEGALGARLLLTKLDNPDALIGVYGRDKLLAILEAQGCRFGEEMLAELDNVGDIVVKGIQGTKTEGREYISWSELQSLFDDPTVVAAINDKRASDRVLQGFQRDPLKAK